MGRRPSSGRVVDGAGPGLENSAHHWALVPLGRQMVELMRRGAATAGAELLLVRPTPRAPASIALERAHALGGARAHHALLLRAAFGHRARILNHNKRN